MRGTIIRLERQLTELQLQQVAAQRAAALSPASTLAESDSVQTPCSASVEVTSPLHYNCLTWTSHITCKCNLNASLKEDRACLSCACLFCFSPALGLGMPSSLAALHLPPFPLSPLCQAKWLLHPVLLAADAVSAGAGEGHCHQPQGDGGLHWPAGADQCPQSPAQQQPAVPHPARPAGNADAGGDGARQSSCSPRPTCSLHSPQAAGLWQSGRKCQPHWHK